MQLPKFKHVVLSSSFCPFSVSKTCEIFGGQESCLIWFSSIDIKAYRLKLKIMDTVMQGRTNEGDRRDGRRTYISV